MISTRFGDTFTVRLLATVFGGPKVFFAFGDERTQPFFETVYQGSGPL
ncbi:MAG: hypothetical protein IH790_00450 [Acidobacteria bacterium]|nr:hypothetical protein [Acidobacteriota bacterium]